MSKVHGFASGWPLIDVLEAVYEVEQPTPEWLTGITRAALPLTDCGVGALLHDLSGQDLRVDAICGCELSPELMQAGSDMHQDPRYLPVIEQNYSANYCESQHEYMRGPYGPEALAKMAALGVDETFAVNGIDHTRRGLALYFFFRQRFRLSKDVRRAYERIAVHLATGYRLHRRLNGTRDRSVTDAAAVITPRGQIEHLRTQATSVDVEHLKDAMQRRTWARGRARRERPHEAVAVWRVLVEGQWSLVDHVDSDGKHFVLAHDNRTLTAGPRELSDREKQVTALAALGRSNKLIAYELGLAHSTVRVLLARAAAKLGARTRGELIEYYARNSAHTGNSASAASASAPAE